jgi:hypothetical protein
MAKGKMSGDDSVKSKTPDRKARPSGSKDQQLRMASGEADSNQGNKGRGK